MNSFWTTLIALPVSTLLIGWVYIAQYKSSPALKPLFVFVHFLSVAAIICFYGYLCYERYVPSIWQYPGWLVFIIGSTFFWYAAFLHKASLLPDHHYAVFAGGPYKYVRHPIYSGGLLGAAGLILVAPSWQVIAAWTILFLSLWILIIIEERELIMRFGEKYQEYCNRTRRIVPEIAALIRI